MEMPGAFAQVRELHLDQDGWDTFSAPVANPVKHGKGVSYFRRKVSHLGEAVHATERECRVQLNLVQRL